MIILISVATVIAMAIPAAYVGNAVGESLTQWLEEHFPNVEE